jgi:hypothetical protein
MAMACADYVVTVSEPHTEALIRQGLSKDRVGIIRTGVDLDLFRQLPFPEHPQFTFAYAGHSDLAKYDNLIAAFDRIKNAIYGSLLAHAGRSSQAV